jgi:hypothetical protein
MDTEINRIKNTLQTLPVIRNIIRNYRWMPGEPKLWDKIKDLCEPLGLTDTAFREYPRLNDFLVSYEYWEERLRILEYKIPNNPIVLSKDIKNLIENICPEPDQRVEYGYQVAFREAKGLFVQAILEGKLIVPPNKN